jgi:hypothetical protein
MSQHASNLQARIALHGAWLQLEAPAVAEASQPPTANNRSAGKHRYCQWPSRAGHGCAGRAVAGTALIAGAGGTVLFGAVGLALSVPMLLRLRRRYASWWAPAIGLAVFAVMFSLSALVIGPAINGGTGGAPGGAPGGVPANAHPQSQQSPRMTTVVHSR